MCSFINRENFKILSFYRLPKVLMSERYDSLILESKVAYSFLLDIVSLSIENDWINENRKIFVVKMQMYFKIMVIEIFVS